MKIAPTPRPPLAGFVRGIALLGTAAAGSVPIAAHAVPSYARQTGMDCSGCHVGAFGPQLTPAGIRFKLAGYSDTDGKAGKVPLSAMLVGTATHTKDGQHPAPEHLNSNDNVKLDEASLFVAGRLAQDLGTFTQLTYSGIDKKVSLDQVDLRAAHAFAVAGKELLAGVSVNNNPTVQDPYNTLPAWSYPFVGPEAGYGTGEAASLVNGGLEQRVFGASAYALWDEAFYAEVGTYRSLTPTAQSKLGLGHDDTNKLHGNAYWRLAWQRDLKTQFFSLGVFGWDAKLAPDRAGGTPTDHYKDLGIDGSYQFLGTREHIVTANASYVREHVHFGDGSDHGRLHETRLNLGYVYRNTWGASGGFFDTHGSDPEAKTRGQLFQLDWTPWGKEDREAPSPFGWANLRLGLQYWRYDRFGGASAGASGHDTIDLFAWTSF
jgi:hypothetical protein